MWGRGFGPAAELLLGAIHAKTVRKTRSSHTNGNAGQKAGCRAEALPHSDAF
jgi:hypothetical protein